MSQEYFSKLPPQFNACIIGASGGIGHALLEEILKYENLGKCYVFLRSETKMNDPRLIKGDIDLEDEGSIKSAAETIRDDIHCLIIASGFLHDEVTGPEKALKDLNAAFMHRNFAINVIGPSLVLKYFASLMPRQDPSIWAAISARVGSISDNKIGGWYSYRASKAALNMMIKTASIELARKYKKASLIGLHPGTVDTALSKPFQGGVKHEVFTPQKSAQLLLSVLSKVSPDMSGKIYAFDGQEVLP